MAKLLRSVGSSETNQKLQNVMFRFSQKNEVFEKERAVFGLCEHSLHDAVEESKKLLIVPLKVGMNNDFHTYLKNTFLSLVDSYFMQYFNAHQEIIADQKALMKANPSVGATGIAATAPAAAAAVSKPSKSDISDAQFVQSTLQVHAKLFEKHRVQSLKKVLHTWLSAELRYHCKVVEELSSVLQDLALVDENEE